MINVGYGSYETRMRGPFQEIANQSDGWYSEDDLEVWPMLNALETAFDAIAEKYIHSSELNP